MSKSLDHLVMRDLEVGRDSRQGRIFAEIKEVQKQILTITANVITLDSIEDIAAGGIGTGLSTGATFDIIAVNNLDTQITVGNVVGVLSGSEAITIDSPFISRDPKAVITVGGANTDPSLLGNIGQSFATGLDGKIPWGFVGYNGSVVYGQGVEVPDRKTIIINVENGEQVYYELLESAPIPYTIDGDLAVDLLNFEVSNGIVGIRGERGLPGPAGVGEVYNWRIVNDESTGQDLSVSSMDGIWIDTRNGDVTLPAPGNPQPSDRFAIADYAGSWEDRPPVLNRNGKLIMKKSDDMSFERVWAVYEFFYVDDTIGWRIL